MRFVIIDLIPALLQWEGRDSFDLATSRPSARELVATLFPDFRLAGITDGDHPASVVHEALERLDLAAFFESTGTSSVFGPKVTPRVVRRVARAIGGAGHAIVVTSRPLLAEEPAPCGYPDGSGRRRSPGGGDGRPSHGAWTYQPVNTCTVISPNGPRTTPIPTRLKSGDSMFARCPGLSMSPSCTSSALAANARFSPANR